MQLPDTSSIINKLFEEYRLEGLSVPYTIKDFRRDTAREYLKELTPEERLAGLPANERLAGLPANERLAGLPAAEVLGHYSEDQIEAYLQRLRKESTTSKKKQPKQRG